MNERSEIRLLALGPPEVQAEDESLALSPKRLAVLAYLALASADDVTRRDTLLATFWPEADSSRARNALNQILHHLRRNLGPGAIRSRGREELVVDDHLHTDVELFESHLEAGDLDAALGLYRGDFMEGFHISGAPRFEHWVDRMRDNLRRRARDTAIARAAEAEEAGRLAEAAGILRRTLEIVPTEEAVARDLIRLLLAAGNPTAAQREYRRMARRLHTRLGLRPADETRRIMSEADLEPDVIRRAPDVASAPSPARSLASDLTTRARELLQAGRAENAAARELLEQATRLDSRYAPAHAALARATAHWVQLFGGPWEQLGSALEAARQALALDPELPEAHYGRAFSLEAAGRASEAVQAYRSVLRLRPSDREAAAHLGRSIQFGGEFAAALRWMESVRRKVEPQPELLHELAMIHHNLGQDDEGEELYDRTLKEQPGFRWAEGSWIYFDLVNGRSDRARQRADRMVDREPDCFVGRFAAADARLVVGDFEGAIRHYEGCYRLDPDSRNSGILRATRTALGFAHLEGGDPVRGQELLDAAEQENLRALHAGASFGGLHYDLASIHAARGEIDQALDWLGSAYRAGWLQHELLDVDPLVRPLHGHEEYEVIRQAMKRSVEEQRSGLD